MQRYLEARPDENKVTSILSRVEVLRVCARESETATALAKILLAGIDVIEISDVVVELASDVHASRSFDAIHLVSALTIQEGPRRVFGISTQYRLAWLVTVRVSPAPDSKAVNLTPRSNHFRPAP